MLLLFKILGKCQLREAVQEKEEGLDSLGNAFDVLICGYKYLLVNESNNSCFVIQLWMMDQIGVWDRGNCSVWGERF